MKNFRMFIWSVAFGLLQAFTSYHCTDLSAPAQSPSPRPQAQTIFGSWDWVQSVGGIAGSVYTPRSVGYTRNIVFRTDSMFESYRNDTLGATTRFTVRREKTFMFSDSVDVIHFADSARFKDQIIFLVKRDSLHLGDLCVDCFAHLYQRSPQCTDCHASLRGE